MDAYRGQSLFLWESRTCTSVLGQRCLHCMNQTPGMQGSPGRVRNRAWGWRKNTWGVEGHVFAGVKLMNVVVACGPAGKGVSLPTSGQCLLALRFHPGGQAAGPREWTPGDRGREILPCKQNIWKLPKAYFSTSLQQLGH